MKPEDFRTIAKKVKRFSDYVYLHVMGEPLLSPNLPEILEIAEEEELKVNITTNGTLLEKQTDVLVKSAALRKVSVSLHSFEGNDREEKELQSYLESVWKFREKSDKIVEIRLWNGEGKNDLNEKILEFFNKKLDKDILSLEHNNGYYKLGEKFFLVTANVFEWPSLSNEEKNTKYCHGLDTHFGILCDGTVVPCCLDSDGIINLGNAITGNLDEILNGETALMIREGFRRGKPYHELCKKCGYAGARFG